jgi:hypothetical protein
MTCRAVIAAACAPVTRAAAWPSASARRPARLPVRMIPASSPTSFAAAANGTAAAVPVGHPGQPRRPRLPGCPQLGIARREAMPAGGAVIPRPADGDSAEHGAHGLVPVGDEPGLVPGRAVGERAPVAGAGAQQRLQQRASEPGQPGPQREFRRLQARAACQRGGHGGGQPRYLRGGVGGERLAEPPLCPSGGGAWPAPAAGTDRASQIASLTSAICPAISANSW